MQPPLQKMSKFTSLVICSVLFATFGAAAPAAGNSSSVIVSSSSSLSIASSSVLASSSASGNPSSTSSAATPSQTVPLASSNPNEPLWDPSTDTDPEAIRGSLGASILGPSNLDIDRQNPDLLAPPTTDKGSSIGNAKWPFSLSHNRLQTGGWARQQNLPVFPIAAQMASVNMRLEAGAVRELHWHTTGEWAYILAGYTQVTAVDPDGKNYLATVGPGDLWYFPAGTPHSLQATGDNPDGSEFILVFDDGNFSEDDTLLLTDWLAHVPKAVIAKNFGVEISDLDEIPAQELYIFPAGYVPSKDDVAVSDPQGTVPNPLTYAFSQVNATAVPGGTVKILDSTTFKASVTIAVAEVTVEPNAIRELHWHPTQDEWSFFLEGQGRVTLFAGQSNARTFNYEVGDIGYVPAGFGHYVENTGNTTLKYLEVFKTDKFSDVSLNQWLALTPPELVKAHLGFSDATIAKLSKTKPVVAPPFVPSS